MHRSAEMKKEEEEELIVGMRIFDGWAGQDQRLSPVTAFLLPRWGDHGRIIYFLGDHRTETREVQIILILISSTLLGTPKFPIQHLWPLQICNNYRERIQMRFSLAVVGLVGGERGEDHMLQVFEAHCHPMLRVRLGVLVPNWTLIFPMRVLAHNPTPPLDFIEK